MATTSPAVLVTTTTGTTFSLSSDMVLSFYDNSDDLAVVTLQQNGSIRETTLTISATDLATAFNYVTNKTIFSIANTNGTTTTLYLVSANLVKVYENGINTTIQYFDNYHSVNVFYTTNTHPSSISSDSGVLYLITLQGEGDILYLNKNLTKDAVANTQGEALVLDSASVVVAGTDMVAGSTILTLTSGTYTTQATARVTHTKAVAAPAVAVGHAGTGYVTGDHVKLTTGTGTQAIFSVTASAGAVSSLALVSAGDYTVNPTNSATAATTAVTGVGTGLQVVVTIALFGALTVAPLTKGIYSVAPTNPISTTGGDNAATLNGTFLIETVTDSKITYDCKEKPTYEILYAQETLDKIIGKLNS